MGSIFGIARTIVELVEKQHIQECKGLIYRAYVSNYMTARGFACKFELREMKKLSCSGCNYCGSILDFLSDIHCEDGVQGMDNLEDGRLYRLEICDIYRDWETGYIEDWHLKLVDHES